jgi:hypothetical protein
MNVLAVTTLILLAGLFRLGVVASSSILRPEPISVGLVPPDLARRFGSGR